MLRKNEVCDRHLLDLVKSDMKPKEATDLAATLIKLGASANAKDADGNTALHLAVSVAKNHSLVELFLKNGADYGVRNKDGKTAVQIAEGLEDWASIKTIAQYGKKLHPKKPQTSFIKRLFHRTKTTPALNASPSVVPEVNAAPAAEAPKPL
jgi:ankyrin repeat protein